MTTEPDICQAYHRGNPQSVAAHDSLLAERPLIRKLVLDYIKQRGIIGATCEEVEAHVGLKHQTASARITELLAMSRIIPAPHRRRTTSGRTARVVVAL